MNKCEKGHAYRIWGDAYRCQRCKEIFYLGDVLYMLNGYATLETANAELLEALENIRDTARTGLPISSMTQEQYDVHRLIAIAGRADYAIRKANR